MTGFGTAQGRRGFGPKDHLCLAFNVGHLVQDILTLALAHQSPHPHPFELGVADDCLGQLSGQGFLHCIHVLPWHKNASNGGAFLSALDGHFFAHFFDEQIEFW